MIHLYFMHESVTFGPSNCLFVRFLRLVRYTTKPVLTWCRILVVPGVPLHKSPNLLICLVCFSAEYGILELLLDLGVYKGRLFHQQIVGRHVLKVV